MGMRRSAFIGATDYTGAALDDMREHLQAWVQHWNGDAREFADLETRLQNCAVEPKQRDALRFVAAHKRRFESWSADVTRLLAEWPGGIRQRHYETLRQLGEDAHRGTESCSSFRREFQLQDWDDHGDSLEALMERAYARAQDACGDAWDVGNLAERLLAFVSWARRSESDPLAARKVDHLRVQ